MTMFTHHHRIAPVIAVTPQLIVNSGSPENLVSGDIDLKGYNSAGIYAVAGDIDEMGTSPVGAAKIETILEHADDDGTGSPGAYANVALADVVGPTSVTNGVVASSQTDAGFVISAFFEDAWAEEDDLLSRFLPTFIATRAIKIEAPRE